LAVTGQQAKEIMAELGVTVLGLGTKVLAAAEQGRLVLTVIHLPQEQTAVLALLTQFRVRHCFTLVAVEVGVTAGVRRVLMHLV
jgi:hypothetical protein